MNLTQNPKKMVTVIGAGVAFLCILIFGAFSVEFMGRSQSSDSLISIAFDYNALTVLLALVAIVGTAAAIASAFMPEGTLPIKNNLLALIGSAAAFAATLIIWLVLQDIVSGSGVSTGFGVWIGLLGYAASAVCAFLTFKEEQ